MRPHMTWLALAAAALCQAPACAKDWYVSNTNWLASDNNSGSSSFPFKTLSKLTKLGQLASGDTINLACGNTWRESLSLGSGNSAGNLTIRSWPADCGSTAKPVINAAVLLGNISWKAVTGKPYFAYTLTSAEAAQLVNDPEFVVNPANDARPYFKARYPDPATSGNNYALIAGVDLGGATYSNGLYTNALVQVGNADAAAIGSNDVAGADIHMRNELWYVTSGKVSGVSSGKLTVQGLPASLAANDGYVLENKLWMVNKPGEWFYDKATKTLYAINADGSGNAPPAQLELVTRPNALAIQSIPGIKISGIAVRGTVAQAIDVRNSSAPVIEKTLVQYGAMGAGGGCGDNAAIFVGPSLNLNDGCKPYVGATGSPKATLTGNIVQKSGYAGMNIMSDAAAISGNTIDQTGTVSRTRNVMYGLSAAAPGGTISGNTVTNSAYMGLSFSNKAKLINGAYAGETVKDNVVSRYCLYYADCGGIYTYNGDGALDQPTPLTQGPSTVSNNAVLDGVGDYQGSRNTTRHLTVGVYLDNYTQNVTVSNNVLARMGTGVMINAGSQNRIEANVVQAATGQGLMANDGSGGGGKLRNNVVKGNTFHAFRRYVLPANAAAGTLPEFQGGVAQSWHHKSDPNLLFTDQGNVVSNNVAVDAGGKPAQWRLRKDSWPQSIDVSLGKWAQVAQSTQAGKDVIRTPFRPRLTNATGTNLISNGDFNNGLTDWDVNTADLSTTSVGDPHIAGGCTGNCVQFVQNTGSPIQSKAFALDSATGSLYYFEYLAVGATGSKSDATIFNSSYGSNGYQADMDYSNELGGPGGAYETRWTERFFVPSSTDAGSRFAVYSNAGAVTYLDQVKLFKVTSTLTAANLYDPSRYSALLYNNAASGNQTFNCPFAAGCTGAVNHEGTSLTFPLTIAPGGRVLVFLRPSEWAR